MCGGRKRKRKRYWFTMHKGFGQYKSGLVKKDVYSEVVEGWRGHAISKVRRAVSIKIAIED